MDRPRSNTKMGGDHSGTQQPIMAPDIGEHLLLISHLVNTLSSLNIVFSLKMKSGVSPLVFNAHGRQFTERRRKADARAGISGNCE